MLNAPISGIRPSHKFFLLRLLPLIDRGGAYGETTKQLANDVGVSISTAVSAGRFLEEKGYINRAKERTSGRPRFLYQHGPALGCFPVWAVRTTQWQRRLIFFLLDSSDLDLEPCPTINDRLILALLICAADDLGVVSTLTVSQISKCTGLKPASVKARMTALLQLGFIRRSIPGFEGSALFGRVPSIHFLNLNHPLYGIKGVKSTQVANYGFWSSYRVVGALKLHGYRPINKDLAAELVAIARKKRQLVGASGPSVKLIRQYEKLGGQVGMEALEFFSDVVHYFNEPKKVFVEGILQTRIEGYASFILSECWGELLAGNPFCSVDLAETIKADLRPSAHPAIKSALRVSPRESTALLQFLLEVSWALARRYQTMLRSTCPQLPWKEYRFLILPSEAAMANPATRSVRKPQSSNADAKPESPCPKRVSLLAGKSVRMKQPRFGASVMCFPLHESTVQHCFIQDHLVGSSMSNAGSEWNLPLETLFRNGLLSVNHAAGMPARLEKETFAQLVKVKPSRK
ncbi:MAG: hypothetical protein CMK74_20735 [Pseudomonadales bacterium]|nr:hypothetical protein [Pseudomonadales bacterium]